MRSSVEDTIRNAIIPETAPIARKSSAEIGSHTWLIMMFSISGKCRGVPGRIPGGNSGATLLDYPKSQFAARKKNLPKSWRRHDAVCVLKDWLGREDSNLRIPIPKTGALTTWPRPNAQSGGNIMGNRRERNVLMPPLMRRPQPRRACSTSCTTWPRSVASEGFMT